LYSLTIKGNPNEDAVLCTSNKTYAVRSVVLSNSVLVVTRPPILTGDGEGDAIVIRDQVNEILELVPSVPRLHKLGTMLRGWEYDEDEGQDDIDVDVDMDGVERPVSPLIRSAKEGGADGRMNDRQNAGKSPIRTLNARSKPPPPNFPMPSNKNGSSS